MLFIYEALNIDWFRLILVHVQCYVCIYSVLIKKYRDRSSHCLRFISQIVNWPSF